MRRSGAPTLRRGEGLFVQSNEQLGFERIIVGVKKQAQAALPTPGQWTHVVGTYDGQALRLYVDGQLADTTADDRLQDSKLVPSYIGAKSPLSNTLYGALDEFAIYDCALPAGRVSAHFRVGSGQALP